jgi:hypothetical protein
VRRGLAALGLVGLTIDVATLRGPARGAEGGSPPAAKAEFAAPEPHDQARPLAPLYLR